MTGLQASGADQRVAVLGASGSVGRLIVARLLEEGIPVTCQTRSAERLAGIADRVRVEVFDPTSLEGYGAFLDGVRTVVFALGTGTKGRTTMFSDVTRALLAEMKRAGTRRLIAITGVGAGETRGHGGFVYDKIVFPLFTRRIYADKDRQEALIAASDLDWTIVRPAPLKAAAPKGPMEVITRIAPDTRLTSVTREEVARFVIEQLESGAYMRQSPFIGHA